MPFDAAPFNPADTVVLPVAPPGAAFASGAAVDLLLPDLAAVPAGVAAGAGGAGRRVLVVDATAIARKFLMRRLSALGYDVQGVDDGAQALDLTQREAFAIVFVDLVAAPRGGDESLDGLHLCQAIKRRKDHPQGVAPAVVFVTGEGGSADRVRGSLAGCDAYLTKPLADADFIAALHEVDPLFR